MRVLFDNGTPRGVAGALTGHTVDEARSHGWDALRNGAIVVLGKGRWRLIRRRLSAFADAVMPGSFAEVEIPVD